MSGYINESGSYYEGDQSTPADTPVPQRPSALHVWDGMQWVVSQAATNASLLAQMVALDPINQNRAFRVYLLEDALEKGAAILQAQAAQQTPPTMLDLTTAKIQADALLYAENPGYKNLKDLEAQLSALRAQLVKDIYGRVIDKDTA